MPVYGLAILAYPAKISSSKLNVFCMVFGGTGVGFCILKFFDGIIS